jgi:polar amino acid transport system permease protein
MAMSRRKRGQLIRVIQYAVLIIVAAALALIADWQAIRHAFFNVDAAAQQFPTILSSALVNTVIYTSLGFALGLALGLVLALMKLSSVGPYRWLATVYIEVFRGLPALVTIFIVAFGIPIAFQTRWSDLTKITVALGLVAAAYMAETIRAGIQGVPKGQMEAARSLGMTHSRAMASIIVPQGFRLVIPPLTNELVLLLKDTSLVFVLGVTLTSKELLKFGRDLSLDGNSTPLIVIALVYLAITIPMTQMVAVLERRGRRSR